MGNPRRESTAGPRPKKLAFKTAVSFALVGYLVAMGLYLGRERFHLPLALTLAICPANSLVMMSMTDPSLGAIAVVVGPLNAILYGIVGLIVGLSAARFAHPTR